MNRSEVKQAIYDGKVTLGMLRRALSQVNPNSWEASKVNRSLKKHQAIDILRKAIDADARPDWVKMNASNRDVLTATNVLRECGLSALLEIAS